LRGDGRNCSVRGIRPVRTILRRALALLCEKPSLEEQDLSLLLHVHGIAVSTWDFDSWESLTRRSVQLARDSGALRMLPSFLHYWSMVNVAAGQFAAAAAAGRRGRTLCQRRSATDSGVAARAGWMPGASSNRRRSGASNVSRRDDRKLHTTTTTLAPLIYNGAAPVRSCAPRRTAFV
jgi:hypothetical protein